MCLEVIPVLPIVRHNQIVQSFLLLDTWLVKEESMRISSNCFRSLIAIGLVVLLTVSMSEGQNLPLQQATGVQPTQSASPAQSQSLDSSSQDQGGPPQLPQSSPAQTQSGAQTPVGTAAAPYEKNTGIAASRPAGAVIAPAKQRRARSFAIRVAVVVGAAVAIGTVVALSKGSPSRPN